MIQDISPYRLENAFQRINPAAENYFFSFSEQNVLLLSRKDGQLCLPTFWDLQQTLSDIEDLVVYLFSVDNTPLYLIKNQDLVTLNNGCLNYYPHSYTCRTSTGMGIFRCCYCTAFEQVVWAEHLLWQMRECYGTFPRSASFDL